MRGLGFRLNAAVRKDEQREVAALLGAYLREKEVEVDEDRIVFDRGMAAITVRVPDDTPDSDRYRRDLVDELDAFVVRWKRVQGMAVLKAFLQDEAAINAFYATRDDLRSIAANLGEVQAEAITLRSEAPTPSTLAKVGRVASRGVEAFGRGAEILNALATLYDRIAGP